MQAVLLREVEPCVFFGDLRVDLGQLPWVRERAAAADEVRSTAAIGNLGPSVFALRRFAVLRRRVREDERKDLLTVKCETAGGRIDRCLGHLQPGSGR